MAQVKSSSTVNVVHALNFEPVGRSSHVLTALSQHDISYRCKELQTTALLQKRCLANRTGVSDGAMEVWGLG